jgi:hypothetical protein
VAEIKLLPMRMALTFQLPLLHCADNEAENRHGDMPALFFIYQVQPKIGIARGGKQMSEP